MNARAGAIGCFVVAAAVAATSAAAAIPPRPVPPIPVNPEPGPGSPKLPLGQTTATLSSRKAAAKPVALTVKLRYEMVCGDPGRGKAVVTLPAAAFVPGRIDRAAVLVNGKPTSAVGVSGHDVSIAMPAHRKGISCMSIGPGTLTLTLTRAAGLGNPKSAGAYTIRVRRNAQSFEAGVQISA